MNNYSNAQLQKIVDDAPEWAEYVMPHMVNIYYKQISQFNVAVWCSAQKRWTSPQGYSLVENWCLKLSDIRAELKRRTTFKKNDQVVYIDSPASPVRMVRRIGWPHGMLFLVNQSGVWVATVKASSVRHATAEEIAAGHRTDSPIKNDDQNISKLFGPSDHEFDCGQCRVDAKGLPNRMILCPDCGNKRCPQALNHRYKCTGSNAVNQECELKEPSAVESIVEFIANPSNVQPDSITAQLDPAKCRVVDPALPYDEPAKRRVGWVGCLGFGAIGDALQGNQSNFDAMSESHRSPGCKCHAVGEMPAVEPLTECELKSPVAASQQQIGGNHYTKLAIQPMHYSLANKLNAAQHTIIKYVTRYPDKGGIQDLLKARHTIDLLIERLKGEQGE